MLNGTFDIMRPCPYTAMLKRVPPWATEAQVQITRTHTTSESEPVRCSLQRTLPQVAEALLSYGEVAVSLVAPDIAFCHFIHPRSRAALLELPFLTLLGKRVEIHPTYVVDPGPTASSPPYKSYDATGGQASVEFMPPLPPPAPISATPPSPPRPAAVLCQMPPQYYVMPPLPKEPGPPVPPPPAFPRLPPLPAASGVGALLLGAGEERKVGAETSAETGGPAASPLASPAVSPSMCTRAPGSASSPAARIPRTRSSGSSRGSPPCDTVTARTARAPVSRLAGCAAGEGGAHAMASFRRAKIGIEAEARPATETTDAADEAAREAERQVDEEQAKAAAAAIKEAAEAEAEEKAREQKAREQKATEERKAREEKKARAEKAREEKKAREAGKAREEAALKEREAQIAERERRLETALQAAARREAEAWRQARMNEAARGQVVALRMEVETERMEVDRARREAAAQASEAKKWVEAAAEERHAELNLFEAQLLGLVVSPAAAAKARVGHEKPQPVKMEAAMAAPKRRHWRRAPRGSGGRVGRGGRGGGRGGD